MDFFLDLDEDYIEGFFSDVVMRHAEVVGPREGLSLTAEEGPEELELCVDCVEDSPVVAVDCLSGGFVVELVILELNRESSTISF